MEGFILRNNKGQEESLSIYFAHGLITGFSIESKIDITDVKVISDKVRKYFKHSYEKLPKEIQKIINSYPKINISDVYIVEIGDRIIYHLTDIEDGDGDFIGYEFTKGFVKVYHDPVSINLVADISEYF